MEEKIRETVDSLYELVVPVFFNNIQKKGNEVLSDALYKYIYEKYCNSLKKYIESTPNEIDGILKSFADIENIKWINIGEDTKKSILLKDDYFQKLNIISENALKTAIECFKTGVYLSDNEKHQATLKDIDECIEKMQRFNLQQAESLLADTIMDLDFSYGISNLKSLRLARRI